MQLLKINSFTALDINGKLQILATTMYLAFLLLPMGWPIGNS